MIRIFIMMAPAPPLSRSRFIFYLPWISRHMTGTSEILGWWDIGGKDVSDVQLLLAVIPK